MSTPFFISSDFITVVCDNRPHTIYSNESRFVKLRDAIKARAWDDIINIVSLPKSIALFSKGKVQVFDGVVLYDNKEIHNTLTARMLEFHREGFPFESLVYFMDKLMSNPSERSKEQLFAYLELYRLPITDDGDFIAQKKITVDYKDMHTQKIDNSVGQIVEMDRKLVNDDPTKGCHAGLHIGSEDFVKSFGGEGVTILCKINPKDVVSVPMDSSFAKMRVCRYEVIGEVKGEDKKFTSNYAGNSNVTKDICVEKPYIDPTAIKESICDDEGICGCQDDDSHSTQTEGELTDLLLSTFTKALSEVVAEEEDKKAGQVREGNLIGQNPAYEAHKNGFTVYSSSLGQIDPKPSRTRSFFRQVKDWMI